jgi:hypothetical protein
LATTYGQGSKKALSRNSGNSKRAHETSEIWREVHRKAQVQEHPEVEAAAMTLADLLRKHQDVYLKVEASSEMVYSDQTGEFPATSSGGHKYIMTLIEIDSNYIAMEPMKSRKMGEMIRAYNSIMTRLKDRGLKPKKQMLNNDAAQQFLETIESHDIEWELVPPHNHRRNVAERAIQTAKGHIIANMLGCDPTFPLREWHRILPQIEMTLNMLRPSNIRPTVSAHTYVYGIHDYNRMPLAPLGCATQCFASNTQRQTFGAHSMDSWYVGTSDEHYRCQKVFLKETKAVRITDTIVFHHRRVMKHHPAVHHQTIRPG